MTKERRIGLSVIQRVDDHLECQPDTYKVFVIESRKGDDPETCEDRVDHLKESLEFGSFQQALQAFINRL